jgi:alpha-tubulin suppressor-like RCC1 family protein
LSSNSPVRRVESLANIRAVRSLFHERQVSSVFAISEQGELYGWGYIRDGNLGDGTRKDR